MRPHAVVVCSLSFVGLVGCSSTLRRAEVVDARTLIPDARTRVVRIEGDRARIVRSYRDGDVIAGGVVRTEPSQRLLAAGAAVLLAGVTLAVSGIVLLESSPPATRTWCDGLFTIYECTQQPWQRTTGEVLAVAGGFVTVAGIVLALVSRAPHAHVRKAHAWTVAPSAGRANVGATLALSF